MNEPTSPGRVPPPRRQRGAAAVYAIVMMTILVGAGAFAIDLGRVFVARGELQNAADAAALAGASRFYRSSFTPAWEPARSTASAAAARNTAEGTAITVAQTRVGWWDLTTPVNPSSPSVPVTWSTGPAPSAQHGPAIEVTVRRAGGDNGGPLSMTLARLFGIATMDVQATGYAVVAQPPGNADPGQLMPFAIGSCMFRPGAAPAIWNSATNSPVLPGPPFVIVSGAANGCGAGCQCGQWTSLLVDNNSAAYTTGLIQNGNPTSLSIGDSIWIQPGTQATLYGTVDTYLSGKVVPVPIVSTDDLSTKGRTTVVGFACVRILDAIQGGNVNQVCSRYGGQPLVGGVRDNKCVIGQFVDARCTVDGEPGPSTYTTATVAPRLFW